MSDFDIDEKLKSKSHLKIKPPRSYKVLLHNDNFTTMEFVVFVLEKIFNKSLTEATQIMMHVHNNGIGICGAYTYEVAEMKVESVHGLAEQHEFPLQATMEEI